MTIGRSALLRDSPMASTLENSAIWETLPPWIGVFCSGQFGTNRFNEFANQSAVVDS